MRGPGPKRLNSMSISRWHASRCMLALGVLDQGARQLAIASAEGMAGGKPNQLHEVLKAKDSLDRINITRT